jgi:hypothetical protein
MEPLSQVLTTLVAVLSLVLSAYALYVTRKTASGEIHARFVERIVDKRIASYPELWHITSEAYRKSEGGDEEDFTAAWASRFLQLLWDWYYTQGQGIFMNEDSRNAFFELQFALKEFDPCQGRDLVKEKANLLRMGLRADLKLEKRINETSQI